MDKNTYYFIEGLSIVSNILAGVFGAIILTQVLKGLAALQKVINSRNDAMQMELRQHFTKS